MSKQEPTSAQGAPIETKAVIIGAGFSGMCMAIKLREAGVSDIHILEKADEVGGTWRENTYPGAECDIPSALYSYSFEHNPEWQYKWSGQQQIFDYQKSIAAKHHLYEKIHFGEEVASAKFNEQTCHWHVTTGKGTVFITRHLISAVGQLHRPNTPDIPGRDSFKGIAFHSARWDHGADLSGKRVAVIGNAASALQFIPRIAPEVGHLDVYQRSANWVLPKQDRPYKPWEQWLSDKVPFITKLYRFKIWCRCDGLLYQVMRGNSFAARMAARISSKKMREIITDPVLQEKLTPDYPIGAKRVLFSDDYYQALARDNVDVITDPVDHINAEGIATADNTTRDYDAIIFATGFSTNPFLAPMEITGTGGKLLSEHWAGGAHAYLGMATNGFPNLFMLYGPNTNLGHNSIILMIEAQTAYITRCITEMHRKSWHSLEVNKRAEQDYNATLQARLTGMTFSKVQDSWYMDNGKITNNWAGTTYEYRRRTREVEWSDFNTGAAAS
jgi:cation diffusion facilitator CzcD-associated flavoprotein CzcO